WLNNVLSSRGHVRRELTQSDLRLGWNETVFNGLAGRFSDSEIRTLQQQGEVSYIQHDTLLHTNALVVQLNAVWGLSRMSSGATSLPLGSDPASFGFQYTFDDSGGSGVDIYVLDTGIRATHQDFSGRVNFLQSFGAGVPGVDINGHGTHVSGIAIGSVFGIAKSATINMIKCMDDAGAGFTSDIVSAINLAATTAASSSRPAIVSMSLGGPANQVIDDAVLNAVNNLNIPFVVAAGNEGLDASTSSPARLGGAGGNPGVITVGATTIDDTFATFSNTGVNVDLLAPGQDVLSCGVDNDAALKNLSGTSMATPHVAGIAALIMGTEGKLSPADLKQRILSRTVSGVVGGINTATSNILANSGAV
ncbi:subtilisin-like serine protease, partial [Serendipita sp. 399]